MSKFHQDQNEGAGKKAGRISGIYDGIPDTDCVLPAVRSALSVRDATANKGSYGKLLIIAGSPGMAGAAYLSGLAAYRCGIGMVKYFGPEENRSVLQTLLPEAMYAPYEIGAADFEERIRNALTESLDWADYLIVGPGLSQERHAALLLRVLAEEREVRRQRKKREQLCIIDADALNLIAKDASLAALYAGETVITPHVGEMARLLGQPISEIKAHPAETAKAYAARFAVSVVLKDAVSVVVPHTSLQCYINRSGHPAMAKAGSGDVLTGVIAGIAAVCGGRMSEALPAAVWLHGAAGCLAAERFGVHGVLARDLADCCGEVLKNRAFSFRKTGLF